MLILRWLYIDTLRSILGILGLGGPLLDGNLCFQWLLKLHGSELAFLFLVEGYQFDGFDERGSCEFIFSHADHGTWCFGSAV